MSCRYGIPIADIKISYVLFLLHFKILHVQSMSTLVFHSALSVQVIVVMAPFFQPGSQLYVHATPASALHVAGTPPLANVRLHTLSSTTCKQETHWP